VYYHDEQITLYHGDALAIARQLPEDSVNCICTSPPYFGLRNYGDPGQYGHEPSVAEYVERLRVLFAELRRVLADDGTAWLNIGESYARKNMLGIPWSVALALQADGWFLRNAIVWEKIKTVPESVVDRLSNRYEHIFLLSKAANYWFDLDPIRDERKDPKPDAGWSQWDQHPYQPSERLKGMPERKAKCRELLSQGVGQEKAAELAGVSKGVAWELANGIERGIHKRSRKATGDVNRGTNPGDVWKICTESVPGHPAVYPLALPARCIVAGCKPGGTVLDPFSGSGTTGLAAQQLGRSYIGIDINAQYLDLSLRTRLAGRLMDFGETGA